MTDWRSMGLSTTSSSSMDRDDRSPTPRMHHKRKKVGTRSLWGTEASEKKEADGWSRFKIAAIPSAEKKKRGRQPLQLSSRKPSSQTAVPDLYISNAEAPKNTRERPSKQHVIDGVKASPKRCLVQPSANRCVEAIRSVYLHENSDRGLEIGPSKQG
ncbi:unnamed protein product [Calypogeia fissa]